MSQAQWQMILEMFRAKGGVLTTADFAKHAQLWAEYRRALIDLRRNGHPYTAKPIKRNLWEYRLDEMHTDLKPVRFGWEGNQGAFA